MLMIRKYEEKDKKEIKNLLEIENMSHLEIKDEIYVAIEDDYLVGMCRVKLKNNKADLKYIIVKDDNRGEMLGDGILRATFNSLEKKGIKKIYYEGLDPYLTKVGFLKSDDGLNLELDLLKFFEPSCKCSKSCGEIV